MILWNTTRGERLAPLTPERRMRQYTRVTQRRRCANRSGLPVANEGYMYKTILVPLDGSTFSAKAIPVAAALAKRSGAALHLVTVLDPSAYVPFVPGEVLVPVMDTDALSARRNADEAAMSSVATTLAAEGVRATSRVIEGTVVEALSEHATAVGADLVIMTTHGRSGLERLWLGGVATSFLHRAPCPVFLVRPSGETGPDPAAPLPIGTLLVPLDGSRFADTIVPHAVVFSQSVGVPICLFTVAIPNAIPMAPFGTHALLADEGDLTRREDDARKRLGTLAASLPEGATMDVATDMTAARAIIEKATSCGSGVIAMATHGRTGIARLVMGSVADAVLRSAPQAMLLYRPTDLETQSK